MRSFIVSSKTELKKAIQYFTQINIRMNVIFMNSEYVSFSELIIYCTWKNMKMPYRNNKFKISAATWEEKFDIQDCLEYIIKSMKH